MISAFVFATWIVQSLYFLNPKFQASTHRLWLYRSVCARPSRKPRRPISQNEAHIRPAPCFLVRGVRALNHLLEGTWRNIQHSDDYRTVYEKIGNYRQALTDFLAVRPTNLKIINNSKGVGVIITNVKIVNNSKDYT